MQIFFYGILRNVTWTPLTASVKSAALKAVACVDMLGS